MKLILYLNIALVLLLAGCAPLPQHNLNSANNLMNTHKTKVTPPAYPAANNPDEILTANRVNGSTRLMNNAVSAQQQQGKTAVISSFELAGAMAVRSKNKGWTAAINWLQRSTNSYHIRLFGPFGSGTVLINKQGGLVTYRDGPKTASSTSADELLMKQTGIRLPVNNLYYWVRGLPAPGAIDRVTIDQAHHLSVLTQAGYTIHYLSYASIKGHLLPTTIRLQGNNLSIKLVIKRWQA